MQQNISLACRELTSMRGGFQASSLTLIFTLPPEKLLMKKLQIQGVNF